MCLWTETLREEEQNSSEAEKDNWNKIWDLNWSQWSACWWLWSGIRTASVISDCHWSSWWERVRDYMFNLWGTVLHFYGAKPFLPNCAVSPKRDSIRRAKPFMHCIWMLPNLSRRHLGAMRKLMALTVWPMFVSLQQALNCQLHINEWYVVFLKIPHIAAYL